MRLPKIQNAIIRWQQPCQIIRITQSKVDYELTTTETIFNIKGVVQPLEAEKLQLKPFETRAFKWIQLHVMPKYEIVQTQDKIKFDSITYVIMEKISYKQYGFIEYHGQEQYE